LEAQCGTTQCQGLHEFMYKRIHKINEFMLTDGLT
jgi:hypothetical protein